MTLNNFKIKGITCQICEDKIKSVLTSSNWNVQNIKFTKDSSFLSFSSNTPVPYQELNLFFKTEQLSKYTVDHINKNINDSSFLLIKKLYPLILIFSYLLLTVLIVSFVTNNFTMISLMSNFMGAFFITFSFFKFLNINGFVNAFQTYDPIANKWRTYGYFYAFFELAAGITYLINPTSIFLNSLVIILLLITTLGVWKAVRSKNKIQCACLGTIFNLPMTYVTIFENITMIVMAISLVAISF